MNADTPTTTPADTPPADPTALPPAPDLRPVEEPPPPPPPLTWPEWFRPFDIALAIIAVVLAFVLASFVARNPDLWRHLAAGRLITQFQYPVGGDPFTYTAENRPWVNAHWLGEVLLYVLHSIDGSGAVAVGAKAVAFAAAVGLLFRLKKPGAPLWPWAVLAAAAAVAAGAFTHLRPQAFALPVMAGILALLYTADWAKGHKWRMPALVGGLTAVWANVDTFAFLSPLMIGLILAGDWLDAKVFRNDPPPASGDDPFRASPPRPALWRALLLCTAALLLNPTFLGGLVRNPGEAVAQLIPFELDFATADVLAKDRDLYRYTYSVFHQGEAAAAPDGNEGEPGYLSNPILGNNPSGLFTVLVWVVGLAAAGCSFARGLGHRLGRLSHLLVWLVFTLLAAFLHARFVPYAMLVAVPFVSACLNGFGRWVPPLDTLPEQLGRAVRIGCVAGRAVCLLGLLVLVLSAIPGWLHPWNGTAAGRRYVGWAVVPDEGLKRAGEKFASWHADPARAEVLGKVRGLNTHPDLGDYLAYYAPAEKSFVTSRYRLHREELPDVVMVRKQVYADWTVYFTELSATQQAMQTQTFPDLATFQKELTDRQERVKKPVELGWLLPLADKHGIGYVSVAQLDAKTFQYSLYNVRTGFGVRVDELPQYGPPWHLDGRLMVVGRTRSLTPEESRRASAWVKSTEEQAAVDQMIDAARLTSRNRVMGWDVAREVFGPRTPPAAPPPLSVGMPPQQGWEYDLLLLHPPARPIGLDDAAAYAGYIDQLLQRRALREQQKQLNWQRQVAQSSRQWLQGLVTFGGVPAVALTLPQGPDGVTFGPTPAGPPQPPPEPLSEQDVTLPFLAARAARDGLQVDPTAAGGYLSLAEAFGKPTMPVTDVPADLFPVSPLPSVGPSDAELQVITALRRAIGRLPDPGSETDEYTADALRARVELARVYLQVGRPTPIMGYRRVDKAPSGLVLVQPYRHSTVRAGYVDVARTTLNQLNLVVEKVAPPTLSADEQRKAAAKLDDVARGLIPLWQTALQLCEADFWMEFARQLKRDRDGRVVSDTVPPDWWDKIDRREMLPLLVEADYLKKDDWTGWQDKFTQDLAAGKVDPAVVRDRLRRLTDVIDRLVGRRMGRAPKATEHPADAFIEYVQSGLLDQAVRIVEPHWDARDHADESGRKTLDVRATSADLLRLMVWVGGAEFAQGYFGPEAEKLEKRADISADGRALERSKLRMVEFELAKLNGDYARADRLFTELLDTPMGTRPPFLEAAVTGKLRYDPRTGQPVPPMTLTDLVYPDLWRPSDYPPLTPAEVAALPRLLDVPLPPAAEPLMLTGGGMVAATAEREQLRRRLLYQALTHYQRGVYALLGGDPARAREQFDKAADPQGVSRHLTPVPADAPKEEREALPVQRLGPSPQVRGAFGELLPKYRELLNKYDAK